MSYYLTILIETLHHNLNNTHYNVADEEAITQSRLTLYVSYWHW